MTTTALGRISYTNDLPIYAGFDAGEVALPASIVADIPTRLNRALFDGALDLSPISSYFYARHAERFLLLPELCIAADGPVMSVLLASERPLEERRLDVIYVPPDSASARNLVELLLARRYEMRPRFVEASDPSAQVGKTGAAALLIGDRAIDVLLAQRPPAHIYDLGELWRQWTGEMIVFAVWAVRREVVAARSCEVAETVRALRESYHWAQAHRPEVIAAAQGVRCRPDGFYERYFRTLEYEFDARARRGLARFCRELMANGQLARMPRFEFFDAAAAVELPNAIAS